MNNKTVSVLTDAVDRYEVCIQESCLSDRIEILEEIAIAHKELAEIEFNEIDKNLTIVLTQEEAQEIWDALTERQDKLRKIKNRFYFITDNILFKNFIALQESIFSKLNIEYKKIFGFMYYISPSNTDRKG